jgi:glycerol-3-phosphate dehydrogenase
VQRSEIVESLKSDEYDLLIVGGGATGAGIVLDAAGRGLKVAMVEQNDFAEGTSSRSSKLVHGGVRYLEAAVKGFDLEQLQLVYEGLLERRRFLHNAPHLSRRLALISPVYKIWQIPYLLAGLILYDLLSLGHRLGASGFMSARNLLAKVSFLKRSGLKGGIRYFDGQFNDARMVIALVHEALRCGAGCLNHCEVTRIERQGVELVGATVKDRLSGESFEIRARTLINATGPFCDLFRRLAGETEPLLQTSSGVHIVLDRHKYPPPGIGLLISETEDKRVLFVLPWEGHCLVGTTDLPAQISEAPRATAVEIEYLLRHLKTVLDPAPQRSDIRACWSGLRPLVQNSGRNDSSRLLRDFLIKEERGVFSITGGKWTSYRRMAEKLVDRVVAVKGLSASPCRTKRQKLSGLPAGLSAKTPDSSVAAPHFDSFYGASAGLVTKLTHEIEGALHPDFPYLQAEVLFAVRYEFACKPLDVLTRRLPLAQLDCRAALETLPLVVRIMAAELGWDEEMSTLRLQEARRSLQRELIN